MHEKNNPFVFLMLQPMLIWLLSSIAYAYADAYACVQSKKTLFECSTTCNIPALCKLDLSFQPGLRP